MSYHDLSTDNKYFLTSTKDVLKHTIDVLGTDYIVTLKEENPALKYFNSYDLQPQMEKIYTDEKYSIFRNITSYPRFGLYYDYSAVPDDASMLKMISDRSTDLKKTILLEENLPLPLETGTGSAKLIKSTINDQTFVVTTDKPALFYISDSWYPDWKATINNEETKIYRANYAFKAVLMPQGESQLTFTYAPQSLRNGIIVSIASFLCLSLLAFVSHRWKRKR